MPFTGIAQTDTVDIYVLNGNKGRPNAFAVTFQSLTDYKKLCYNDSSIYRSYMERDTTRESGDPFIFYVKEIKKWKHRTPTFEGFTNYLETKYK